MKEAIKSNWVSRNCEFCSIHSFIENGAKSIRFGRDNFEYAESVSLSLTSTQSLTFGDFSFTNSSSLTVTDVSDLEEVEFGKESFQHESLFWLAGKGMLYLTSRK